jgi:hypothetical protein
VDDRGIKTGAADVHWECMAKPQPDEYDTVVALEFAAARGLKLPEVEPDEPRLAFTNLALRHCHHWKSERFTNVTPNHPNLSRAAKLLASWNTGWQQTQRMLRAVYIASDRTAPANAWGGISGSGPLGFGTIAATIDCPLGLAQGIVHEMAHHKLRALGIEFDNALRLIRNSSHQLYMSPIRYDCLRPMPAVFHAQYSFTYVSALNVEIIEKSPQEEYSYGVMDYFLRHHIPKLEFGMDIISRYIELDSDGVRLLNGFREWFSEVRGMAHRLIKELGGVPEPFVHPLSRT